MDQGQVEFLSLRCLSDLGVLAVSHGWEGDLCLSVFICVPFRADGCSSPLNHLTTALLDALATHKIVSIGASGYTIVWLNKCSLFADSPPSPVSWRFWCSSQLQLPRHARGPPRRPTVAALSRWPNPLPRQAAVAATTLLRAHLLLHYLKMDATVFTRPPHRPVWWSARRRWVPISMRRSTAISRPSSPI